MQVHLRIIVFLYKFYIVFICQKKHPKARNTKLIFLKVKQSGRQICDILKNMQWEVSSNLTERGANALFTVYNVDSLN